MVRSAIIFIVLLQNVTATAQTFNVGMRIGKGVGAMMTTGAPRDYFITSNQFYSRYQIRLEGGGILKASAVTPPEIFVSYNFKNRFFLQAGSGVLPTSIYHLYALDPEVEEKYNPVRTEREVYITIPKDYIATRSKYLFPYLVVGANILEGRALKPFVSLGVSPAILMSYEDLNTDTDERIILKDIGHRRQMVLTGRASVGVRFYDLHVELYGYSNINSIDDSANSYNERFAAFFLSVGYNFLSFNTVKKKRI